MKQNNDLAILQSKSKYKLHKINVKYSLNLGNRFHTRTNEFEAVYWFEQCVCILNICFIKYVTNRHLVLQTKVHYIKGNNRISLVMFSFPYQNKHEKMFAFIMLFVEK